MATILPFVVSPRPAVSGRNGDAAIIIFPGVRYEAVDNADGGCARTDGGGKPTPGRKSCKSR